MTITQVQSWASGNDASGTTHTATLPVAATAGNLIVLHVRALVGSGGITGGPSGSTQVSTPSVDTASPYSMATFYKVAAGGETSLTYTTSTSVSSRWLVSEWSASSGWPATAEDVRITTTSGGSMVLSQTTGTTAATAQAEELAVAVFALQAAPTSPSVSNSFTGLTTNTSLLTATKVTSATGTQETTLTWTTTSLRANARLVVFHPNVPGPPAGVGFFGAT